MDKFGSNVHAQGIPLHVIHAKNRPISARCTRPTGRPTTIARKTWNQSSQVASLLEDPRFELQESEGASREGIEQAETSGPYEWTFVDTFPSMSHESRVPRSGRKRVVAAHTRRTDNFQGGSVLLHEQAQTSDSYLLSKDPPRLPSDHRDPILDGDQAELDHLRPLSARIAAYQRLFRGHPAMLVHTDLNSEDQTSHRDGHTVNDDDWLAKSLVHKGRSSHERRSQIACDPTRAGLNSEYVEHCKGRRHLRAVEGRDMTKESSKATPKLRNYVSMKKTPFIKISHWSTTRDPILGIDRADDPDEAERNLQNQLNRTSYSQKKHLADSRLDLLAHSEKNFASSEPFRPAKKPFPVHFEHLRTLTNRVLTGEESTQEEMTRWATRLAEGRRGSCIFSRRDPNFQESSTRNVINYRFSAGICPSERRIDDTRPAEREAYELDFARALKYERASTARKYDQLRTHAFQLSSPVVGECREHPDDKR